MKFRSSNAAALCAGLTTALMGLATGSAVQAQEVYGGVGLFGAQVGYAYAVSPSVTVRGDYMTLGSRSKTTNESGTEYQANVKWNRTALLADWFLFESSTFRLTGGATFNHVAADLTAGGAGTTVDINGKTYKIAFDCCCCGSVDFGCINSIETN